MKDKISKEIHDAMVSMRECGFSNSHIGRVFGIHHTTVQFDLSGKRKSPYRGRKEEAISILRAALARLEAA